MRIADIIRVLEAWAPPVLQEDYDNSGLQVGDRNAEVRAALMSANEPSDQMIDVLCAMNRGGFPVADMMKVITVSNEKSGG